MTKDSIIEKINEYVIECKNLRSNMVDRDGIFPIDTKIHSDRFECFYEDINNFINTVIISESLIDYFKVYLTPYEESIAKVQEKLIEIKNALELSSNIKFS